MLQKRNLDLVMMLHQSKNSVSIDSDAIFSSCVRIFYDTYATHADPFQCGTDQGTIHIQSPTHWNAPCYNYLLMNSHQYDEYSMFASEVVTSVYAMGVKQI